MCIMTDIARCPLYIASHESGSFGCVDDMARPCRVDRGELDFQQALLRLAANGRDYPGLVQMIETKGAA